MFKLEYLLISLLFLVFNVTLLLVFILQVNITVLSTIRVIPFCGKVDEWPIWSKKFLVKAKRYGFKDASLGKLSIPKIDDSFDDVSDQRKRMLKII
jgi:hypothetical protein